MARFYADKNFDYPVVERLRDHDALAARIDKAVLAAGSIVGQHLRVNKPP
jgi:hypothetical protein